ncbi:MAG: cation transporter [Candidatus Eisenbacteria sp.]|nr:cation transporter [Candidatus Eisenbacteria bacterium]
MRSNPTTPWGDRDPRREVEAARSAVGTRTSVISILINVLLGLIKIVLGAALGSVALIADAFHSLSDAGSSAIVLLGFRAAARPPDPEHPFGHGRAEHIATSFLAALLLAAAFEFIKTSIGKLAAPEPIHPSYWMLGILVLTIGVKEWLAIYTARQSKAIASDALAADAWHHRTDSITTGLVILGLLGSRFGLYWLDPALGIGVGAMVGFLGYALLRKSLSALLGEAPSAEEIAAIHERAMTVDGVLDVHDIIVHRYGIRQWISLHVEVPGEISACDLHDIADSVERHLSDGGRSGVIVHADPVRKDHPQRAAVMAALEAATGADPRISAFQDVRLFDCPGSLLGVSVDVRVRPGLAERDERAIHTLLVSAIARAVPGARVVVDIGQDMTPRS